MMVIISANGYKFDVMEKIYPWVIIFLIKELDRKMTSINLNRILLKEIKNQDFSENYKEKFDILERLNTLKTVSRDIDGWTNHLVLGYDE